MEDNKNADYFSIHPPRLEDAGLEDSALPVEDIQEAFRRAVVEVQSRTFDLLEKNSGENTELSGQGSQEWECCFMDTASLVVKQKDPGSYSETQTSKISVKACDSVVELDVYGQEDGLKEETAQPKLGKQGHFEDESGPELYGSSKIVMITTGNDDTSTLTEPYV
eukprot:c21784_g1_i3 orf=210-704(+)